MRQRTTHRVWLGVLLAPVLFAGPLQANNLSDETEVPLPKALAETGNVNVGPSFGVVSDAIPIIVSPGRLREGGIRRDQNAIMESRPFGQGPSGKLRSK